MSGLGWSSATSGVCFCLAGAGIGLAETAESTLVAHLLPDRLRGSGFGLLGGLQSAGDFLSSAVVGVLYAAVSPTLGFAYAPAGCCCRSWPRPSCESPRGRPPEASLVPLRDSKISSYVEYNP